MGSEGGETVSRKRARAHTHTQRMLEENKELNRGQAFNLSTIRLAMET